jgi:hypothetical protein
MAATLLLRQADAATLAVGYKRQTASQERFWSLSAGKCVMTDGPAAIHTHMLVTSHR